MELRLPHNARQASSERLDEVARLTIDVVARELVEILGLKRTAAIGNVKDTRRVQEWISRDRQPQHHEALRTALQAARLIADTDGPLVAKAWFTGCNQHLNLAPPILALQSDDPETFSK